MTSSTNHQSDAGLTARLRSLAHIALDMDGTIYTGDTLLPCTIPFLEQLRQLGIRYSFVTNNPSKSVTDYLAKLERRGLHPPPHLVMPNLAELGILFQTLPYGASDAKTYHQLLDAGLASFSTDYPNVTLKAVHDYYEAAGKIHTKKHSHEESNAE